MTVRRLSKQRRRRIHERYRHLGSRWTEFVYLRTSFTGMDICGYPWSSDHQVRWAIDKLATETGAVKGTAGRGSIWQSANSL